MCSAKLSHDTTKIRKKPKKPKYFDKITEVQLKDRYLPALSVVYRLLNHLDFRKRVLISVKKPLFSGFLLGLMTISLTSCAHSSDSKTSDDLAQNVEFRMKYLQLDKDKSAHFGIFIDSDNNPKTGYSRGNIKGADLLIEDSKLFLRQETSSEWDQWKELGNLFSLKIDGSDTVALVPETLVKNITLTNNAPLVAYYYDKNWIESYAGNGVLVISGISAENTLKISVTKTLDGVALTSITDNNKEILKSDSKLFTLLLHDLTNNSDLSLSSDAGWNSVSLTPAIDGGYMITLSEPNAAQLPKTLKVDMRIRIKDKHSSSWDIKVSGIGQNHSLMDIAIAELNLKTIPGAHLLVPKYTGVLHDSSEDFDLSLIYPAGWSSTMQFFAYYGDDFGLYLGSHDPKASKKRFIVKKENNHIKFATHIVPPDKTIPDNNFQLSGKFELDAYKGDWFEAATIYKKWASNHADYYPSMTPQRVRRQHNIGEISLWAESQYIGAILGSNAPDEMKEERVKNYLQNVKNILGEFSTNLRNLGLNAPVGVIWNEWYGTIMDIDYPNVFFPADENKSKIAQTVSQIRQEYTNLRLMPYTNGYIHDMDSGHYTAEAKAAAAKDIDNTEFKQHYKGHDFAIMDPTQNFWQEKIAGAADVVLNDIGADGVYIDQITAARSPEDMDKNHGHALAGGSWWREGYDQLLRKVDKLRGDKFVTSEAMCDFMLDHIDGLFIHYNGVNNMVPAFQVVYGGKVQLFGLNMDASMYYNPAQQGFDPQSYYMGRIRSFIFGTQVGSITTWLINHTDATGVEREVKLFTVGLAKLRYHLREFLSYGEKIKDIEIVTPKKFTEGQWTDFLSEVQHIKMPMLMQSVYRSEDGKKVAFILGNSSMSESVNYAFDIDPTLYGFDANARVKLIKFDTTGQDIETTHISGTLAPKSVNTYVLYQADTDF